MARLIYSAITSLDGYVADENGNFDWAAPDEEVHAFVNDLERPIGTLSLRAADVRGDARLGDAWTRPTSGCHSGLRPYLAGGRQDGVSPRRWRRCQRQDAHRARVRPGSDAADESDGAARHQRGRSDPRRRGAQGGVGGRVPPVPHARRGGGGTPSLPDHVRLQLELLDERRFASGVVHLHYRVVD